MNQFHLPIVKAIWRIADEHDFRAVIDGMGSHFADDAELNLFSAGTALRGPQELKAYFVAHPDLQVTGRAYSFSEEGDSVLVEGAVRVRNGGSLSESQLRWRFDFRDGLIAKIDWEPLEAPLPQIA